MRKDQLLELFVRTLNEAPPSQRIQVVKSFVRDVLVILGYDTARHYDSPAANSVFLLAKDVEERLEGIEASGTMSGN